MKKNLKKILQFRKERDWEQFHLPKNLARSLVLETGEVLELFQWTKDNKLPKGKDPEGRTLMDATTSLPSNSTSPKHSKKVTVEPFAIV